MKFRSHWAKAALLVIGVLLCTACAGQDIGKTTIKPSPFASYSPDPNSEVGSRNNPISLGDEVTTEDWVVQVTNVNKNAYQSVKKEDSFDSPPMPNEKFVLFTVKATYTGEESGEPNGDLRFKIVGSKGNTFTNSCGFSTDTFQYNGETFTGASVTGNLCFVVDADQIDGATISIQAGYSTDVRKFVSIDSK